MKHKPSTVAWVSTNGMSDDYHERLTSNNRAMLYIAECAKAAGIEITENTAFDMCFIAKIMKALRGEEKHDE